MSGWVRDKVWEGLLGLKERLRVRLVVGMGFGFCMELILLDLLRLFFFCCWRTNGCEF